MENVYTEQTKIFSPPALKYNEQCQLEALLRVSFNN